MYRAFYTQQLDGKPMLLDTFTDSQTSPPAPIKSPIDTTNNMKSVDKDNKSELVKNTELKLKSIRKRLFNKEL